MQLKTPKFYPRSHARRGNAFRDARRPATRSVATGIPTPSVGTRSSGFTIMEVLVAMLILVTGLIGIAGLQLRAQQFNYTAYFRSQATFLANDLMERIRINTDTTTTNNNGDNGAYAFPNSGFTNVGPGGVTTVDTTCDVRPADTTKPICHIDNAYQLVNYDLNNWFNQVRETLPTGTARIVWDGTNRTYTITIQWKRMPNTISYDGELKWTLQL